MKKWEYKYFNTNSFNKWLTPGVMNEMGEYGWELVGFEGKFGLIFKREKTKWNKNPAHKNW